MDRVVADGVGSDFDRKSGINHGGGRAGKKIEESLLLFLISRDPRDPRGSSIFAVNRFEIRSRFGFIYRTTLRIAKLRPSIARSVARIPLRWSISC